MKKALLIIDVQNFYFDEGPGRLHEPVKAAEQIAKVLTYCRETNQTVIHVQQLGPEKIHCESLEPIDEIYSLVAPLPGETVVKKPYPSAFRDTGLKELLDQKEIEELVIVGMMSHMCVDTTVRAASAYGYPITVLHDCCTTRALTFQDTTIDAVTVHKTYMASFIGFFAEVMSTKEYLEKIS